MLLLVLADNYLVLFVGWEGVGLASYLLIGFWQHKPTAATAAKKAFVVNRVGDLGMSIAIMLMLAAFGSSAFVDVNAGMPPAMPGDDGHDAWACCCCSGPAASPPRCRCSPGCWTPWRARPRCRR